MICGILRNRRKTEYGYYGYQAHRPDKGRAPMAGDGHLNLAASMTRYPRPSLITYQHRCSVNTRTRR